jgi:hypothetical protein
MLIAHFGIDILIFLSTYAYSPLLEYFHLVAHETPPKGLISL